MLINRPLILTELLQNILLLFKLFLYKKINQNQVKLFISA